ncbi:MAG: GGDEF domain-containing protein [Vicinamibacteria bacterium]
MELLLWRWSTTVQLSSLAMIAIFFAVLARSVRAAELRWWVWACCANFGALSVALGFWYLRPPEWMLPGVRVLYMGAKTAFVLLLLEGAWSLRHRGGRLWRAHYLVPAFTAYVLVAAFVLSTVDAVGVVQHLAMGALLLVGFWLLRKKPLESGLTWLSIGFLLRSVLSFVEAAAYALQFAPQGLLSPGLRGLTGTFLASHSSFDSGTEWLIALGCVLALSERAQRELRQYNRDLLDAQADLRKLVDRDPLTGLANRRSLGEILRIVKPEGATLLFFDLDDFKQVNDWHGHNAGDECLRRFAKALMESFRPTDGLVRYAGDEFLVVARGLDEASADERIRLVRERLRRDSNDGVTVTFSVGIARFPPEGDPEKAIQQADESMYRAKEEGRRYRGVSGGLSTAY